MKIIKEYLIEGGFDHEEIVSVEDDKLCLMENVDRSIKSGWQPFGSPFLDKEGCICQAMVMYKEI